MRRKTIGRNVAVVLSVGALVALAGLMVAQSADAQPGRRGGRGGGAGRMGGMNMNVQDMMYLDATWAAVAFECGAKTDQITKLRPTYQSAYDSRNKARTKAREKRDPQVILNSLKATKSTIEAKLKQVLTSSQMSKLKAWQQKQATLMRGARGGGGRGGRGGKGMMMGQAAYIERTWSAVAFETKVSDSQLAKLRPTYQSAWKTRKGALEKDDAKALQSALTKIKASIDAKLKAVLTDKQWAAFEKRQTQRQGGRQGAGGKGQRGGGRGR